MVTHLTCSLLLAGFWCWTQGPGEIQGTGPPPAVAGDHGLAVAAEVEVLRGQIAAHDKFLLAQVIKAREAGPAHSEARQEAVLAAMGQCQRQRQVIVDRVIEVVRSHPDDPAALDGILLLGPMFDDDLAAVVRDHFLADPRMGLLAVSLADRNAESSPTLLREIIARNPNHNVRGQATLSLGLYWSQLRWELVEEFRIADARLDQLYDRFYQRSYRRSIAGRRLTAAEEEVMLAETRGAFARVVDQYPDVRSPDGSIRLADWAKAEITRLDETPRLWVGQLAPDIIGETLDGQPLRLSDYRGRVVVLCFWGTWCQPCMAMVPLERDLVERLKGKPFALIGVNCDETSNRDHAGRVAQAERMTWSSFWDGGIGGPIELRYNVKEYPTTFVLDADGMIRFINARDQKLDDAVASLLGELQTKPR